MNLYELSTPALVVDLDIVERNLDRMAKLCREQGVRLRPHTKTHKTPGVARMQVQQGAIGVTVAKVGEAEVMGEAGLDEILVAYPVLGAEKLRRLAILARDRSVLVSLDDERTAQELSRAAVEAATTFGVKALFTSARRRLWSGGSSISIERCMPEGAMGRPSSERFLGGMAVMLAGMNRVM
jgi:D-serine deaminase-like pyridoxal phosphate-dependent protein